MERGDHGAESTNVWSFGLQTGFFAGLIWGAVKALEAYLHFTEIPAQFMAKPFLAPSFVKSVAGFWMGWLVFIVFSIVASLLYALVLRKVRGPWTGLCYGAAWWVLIYLLVGPSTGMMKWINRYEWNTIITDVCLFLVWGLFIGFSIAFEFTDERNREPGKAG
ncbi:MAG: hypothetical protein K0Q59_97 [Paenibacillus sp.]|nr:hypothetical protein [Paenibacillus sp.]